MQHFLLNVVQMSNGLITLFQQNASLEDIVQVSRALINVLPCLADPWVIKRQPHSPVKSSVFPLCAILNKRLPLGTLPVGF